MAILRKDKKEKYTVIDNSVFFDYQLSLKAKGLLCQMLSLPDEWSFSVAGLARCCRDGKDSVASALNELQRAGYFKRVQKKAGGKYIGVEYVVSEVKFADSPYTENPIPGNPITEKPSQLNTNKSNTKKLNTKEIYSGLPEELITALMDFEEMRKRVKAPLSDRARQMLLQKLDRLAGDDTQKKIAILEQSIFNSWKGVFDLDDRRSNQKRSRISGTVGAGASGNNGATARLPAVEASLLENN